MSTTTTVYGLTKHARGDTPWDVEVNADLDTIDAEIAKPRIIFNSPTVGATTTCDLSLGRVFVFTVSQATTLAFTNVPSSSFATFVDLLITNGAAFVLTFPGSVTWLQGSAPTLQAAGVDRIRLATKDGGTTWYAVHFGKNLSLGGSLTFVSAIAPTIAAGMQSRGTGNLQSGAGSPANLKSYVVPANTLGGTGQSLHLRAWGQTANNANAKTVRVSFAGTLILALTTQVSVADNWFIDCTIVRNSGTTVNAGAFGLTSGTAVKTAADVGIAGLTFSNPNTIQVDCTQVAAADVSQDALMVEYCP